MNDIVTIISTVGFPITACLVMGWFVKYQTDTNNKEVAEMRVEHKEETARLTDALNGNTLVLQKLCDKLDERG